MINPTLFHGSASASFGLGIVNSSAASVRTDRVHAGDFNRAGRSLATKSGLMLAALLIIFQISAAQTPKTMTAASCKGIDPEAEGYVIRSWRIDDPFTFLPWVKSREDRAKAKIAPLLNGQKYVFRISVDEALKIIENENFLPDSSEPRVKLRVEFVNIANCADKKLDLIYRIYSTQILPVLSGSPESRTAERQAPQTAAGMTNVDVPRASPIQVFPLGGYDATDKLSAGARIEASTRGTDDHLIKSAFLEGQASSQMHTLSAAITGARDYGGWLAHLDWRLDFRNFSLPTGSGKVKGGSLTAQFSGVSQPLVDGNLTFRFGGLLEGGNRQSQLSKVRLAPKTVPDSPFGAVKLYAGLASRLKPNTISASYGLQLGAAGRRVSVDWVKHLLDVRHEFWYPLGDHRMLDLESQFTLGSIHVRDKIPVSERFFGGNQEDFFIPGESWQIRANPVIRAIPGKRFYRVANGDGGESFMSYNLTLSYPLWRKSVVPTELSKDDEFNQILNGQLQNATEFVKLYFMTKDAHYLKLVEILREPKNKPALPTVLAELTNAVNSAKTAHPGQFPDLFEACSDSLGSANFTIGLTATQKGEVLFGSIMGLLSIDTDQLGDVNNTCVVALNGPGGLQGDAGISQSGAAFNIVRSEMEKEAALISQEAAGRKADADMVFVRRTLYTIMNELNVYSVSPVFVFDYARLGPKGAGLGGARYGPGGGLRFELASSVHFTAGYARNARPGPGEGRGTFFFSIGLRDLFQ